MVRKHADRNFRSSEIELLEGDVFVFNSKI